MIKVFDVSLFKATKAASAKSDVRFYLNGVLFTKGGYVVATDGHVLVKTKCTDYDGDDVILNFPRVVPAKTDSMSIDIENKIVAFLNDGSELDIRRLEIVDGRFPDYSKIIPKVHKGKSDCEYALNPSLLADIQKQGGFYGFKFNMSDPRKAILFSPDGEFDSKFIGVVMPMKI